MSLKKIWICSIHVDLFFTMSLWTRWSILFW